MSEHWRNRIVGDGVVEAATLTAHPLNYRDHPMAQRNAVNSSLDAIGWVKEVVVNERTGRVIDGHLRVEAAAQQGLTVPVQYVDLTDNEESLVLASLDPMADMAGTDHEQLEGLIGLLNGDAGLADLKNRIAEAHSIDPGGNDGGQQNDHGSGGDDSAALLRCPRCGHEWDPNDADE